MSDEQEELLTEVRDGLAKPQKELPTRLFYDERGSELFEQITQLPEYYLTRAEQALIGEHVPGWIAEQRPRTLVELGAGSATKTRMFLDAMGAGDSRVTYVPVDVSMEFLDLTVATLRREYPLLDVVPVAASFARSLELPTLLTRPVMITFLGSTIGNFATPEAVDILRRVRSAMHPDDRFVPGFDLRKKPSIVEAAYNDAHGVTAQFNLNMLRVVNHRFGADFKTQRFRHRAFYSEHDHRVEMHLVATDAQSVTIPRIGTVQFDEGESIRTEISCKYDRTSVTEMLSRADLELIEWCDGADGMFALSLASPRR